MSKLKQYRHSIDLLDQALVCLITERMKIVKKVGEFKKEQEIVPLDQKRWNQVINSKRKLATKCGVDPKLVEDILELIHEKALEIEK
jgi:chorismate mutase